MGLHAALPEAAGASYTTPMSNDNEQSKDAQDRERIERLENLFLEMAEGHRELRETQQKLTDSALKHDMMLEMLQAVQRDHTRDIQEHKETQQRHEEMLNRIVAMQERMFTIVEHLTEIQQDHASSIRRHEETQRELAETQREQKDTQEAMRVAIQTLSNILRRLTENGNSSR